MKITCKVERTVSLTHRSIVRCRYNLGSLRKCRKWKLLRPSVRRSAHLLPLLSWCSSGGATPAHPFPAIFGNFRPFTRANNTRAVCGTRRAVIWKGNRVFPGKNLAASDGGKKSGLCFDAGKTRSRQRIVETRRRKSFWNDAVAARVLKIGFVQFSNLARFYHQVYRRIWSRVKSLEFHLSIL